jgi:hypothetical protein
VEGLPTYEDQVSALTAGPPVKQGFRTWMEKDYETLEAESLQKNLRGLVGASGGVLSASTSGK